MRAINKRMHNDNLKPFNVKVFLLLTLFSILFLLPLVQAIQIETKEEFAQDETMIAKISGNFVDSFGTGNIFFYREHVRVPTQFSLSKIKDDYYLYATLSRSSGKNPGNYSLQIQNVKYKVGTQIKEDDVIKNFTINNETADFYVVPGFIKTKGDFYLELTNLRDWSMEVEVTSENSSTSEDFWSFFGTGSTTQTIALSSGQTKKVNFQFDDTLNESTLQTITFESENTSYSVPVYMETENNTITNRGEVGKLSLEPFIFNVSVATNSNTTRIIYLYNRENASVQNISLYVSEELEPYVNLSVAEIREMDDNSTIKIAFTVSSGDSEKNLEGQITAKYENAEEEDVFVHSAIFLTFIKDYIPKEGDNDTIVINSKTCLELNGTKCSANEICPGESVYAQDGNCCVVQCTPKEESSSTGKIIGWSLVALVVLFVGWFLRKRYKKTSSSVDLLKISKGKR